MSAEANMKVLVIGFGNPGRLDDGLGPALAEALEQKKYKDVTVDANYLLTVEDASAVAEHDVVIFADAAITGEEPFSFKSIEPKTANTFSSHSIEPEIVLGLAYDLFQATTRGFVLGIRGYDFDEFGQKISSKAQDNLISAVQFICGKIEHQGFNG